VGFFQFGNGRLARILLSQNNTNQQWQLHSSEGHKHVLLVLFVTSNTSLALMFIHVVHKNSVPNVIKHNVTIYRTHNLELFFHSLYQLEQFAKEREAWNDLVQKTKPM